MAGQVTLICSMYNRSFHEPNFVTFLLPVVSLHGAQDNISEKLFFLILRMILRGFQTAQSFELGKSGFQSYLHQLCARV